MYADEYNDVNIKHLTLNINIEYQTLYIIQYCIGQFREKWTGIFNNVLINIVNTVY